MVTFRFLSGAPGLAKTYEFMMSARASMVMETVPLVT